MSKHTPGPWVTQPSNAERWSQIVRPEHGVWPYDNVAYIQEMNDKECTIQGAHIPNAKLIAAAPDLLAALQEIMTGIAGCQKESHYEAARAAIQKATGAA